MFLPDEIDKKSFSRTVGGYSPSEADEFFEHIKTEVSELYRENETLRRALGEARFDGAKLRLKIKKLEAEIDGLQYENDDLQNEIDELKAKSEEPRSDPEEMNSIEAVIYGADDDDIDADDTDDTDDENIGGDLTESDVNDGDGDDVVTVTGTGTGTEEADIPDGDTDAEDTDADSEEDAGAGELTEHIVTVSEPDDEYGEDEIPSYITGSAETDAADGEADDIYDIGNIDDADEAKAGGGHGAFGDLMSSLQKMFGGWQNPSADHDAAPSEAVSVTDAGENGSDGFFRPGTDAGEGDEASGDQFEIGTYDLAPGENVEPEPEQKPETVNRPVYRRRVYHIKKKTVPKNKSEDVDILAALKAEYDDNEDIELSSHDYDEYDYILGDNGKK